MLKTFKIKYLIKIQNFKFIFFFVVLFCGFFGLAQKSLAASPVLNFSDLTSGPKTGLGDGLGQGAIVTIWGNYLGSTQGASKVYFKDSLNVSREAAYVYYWKNADGTLPGGPSDLYSYHKMQEIAFSIPAGSADGAGKIHVTVNGTTSNELDFMVRAGNLYFVKSSGNDSTGNGSWGNPWLTLQSTIEGGNGKMVAGDVLYSDGVGTASGLVVGRTARINGTDQSPIFVTAYPNSSVDVSGYSGTGEHTITYFFANSNWNWSKISISTEISGINISKNNRLVGLEITGPTVFAGYAGAIGGSCSDGNDNCGGGKYLGIYIHNYGTDTDTWDVFQHLYYVSNRSGEIKESYEVGWNHLANNPILQGIHIYDQVACGDWSGTMKIHDNVVKNQRGSAINVNLAGCTPRLLVPFEIYNNILITDPGCTYAGEAIKINTPTRAETPASNNKVYNNTVYGFRAINNFVAGNTDFRNNVVVDSDNLLYDTNRTYFWDGPTTESNNLFFSTANPSLPLPTWAAGAIGADPDFVSPAGNDFGLSVGSPAISAGTNSTLTVAPRDFFGQLRQSGSVSLGAVEYNISSGADVTAPSAPTGLSVN
jgi:hypothetical protein